MHVQVRPEPPRSQATADPHRLALQRARRVVGLAAAVTLAAGLLAAAAGSSDRPAGPEQPSRPPRPNRTPTAVGAPSTTPPPFLPPPKPRVYVLTDSVMIGAHEAMRRTLGDRYDLHFAGWVGLSLPAAIDLVRSTRSQVGDVVVVQLGNNYGGNPGTFGRDIDRLMGALAGVDQVIWLNVQEFSPRQHEVNVELAGARERWANLTVADWFAVSGSAPGLVGGQAGIHLTARGAAAAAALIGRELDAWAASRWAPPGAWPALDVRFRGGLYLAGGRLGPRGAPRIVVGAGPGAGPQVSLFTPDGRLAGGFFPFPDGFRGGVRVAACDTDGDGVDEVVSGAGPSGAPVVAVHDAAGHRLHVWLAYDPAFAGGVFVGCGDLDGDGRAEVVTGPGAGGGPDVRVFSGAGHLRGSFWAYDRNFTGGVHVAAGDLDGDGRAEVVTGPGAGGGPDVRVFSGAGHLRGSFWAYDRNFTGGVHVAAGDLDGDGRAEVVTGPGDGGGAHVRAFDAAGREARPAVVAFPDPAGARVAVLPTPGHATIVVAPGRRGRPWVRPLP